MIKINEKHEVSSRRSKLDQICSVLDRLMEVIELSNVKY